MSTENQLVEKKQLPPLIKQSSTYKLYVPRKVEEKIRYLCRKFPTLEWSGVLFTRHTGNFEDGSLEIHCEDIYPMDLGSPGFTQFKMDETVTAYIAENIELFDCDIQLLHSHNQMGCFFSGQDQATLREEGNDRNCFVSLIVNNEGTYCAAITRKMQTSTEVVTKSLGTSYEFFGEGPIKTDEDPMTESTKVVDKEVIEYFMLDVEVEHVDNPLESLDARFEEIEAKKKAEKPIKLYVSNTPDKTGDKPFTKPGYGFEEDGDFYKWLHSERKKDTIKEEELFSEAEMIDAGSSDWQPDEGIIKQLVNQLVTSSLIVNSNIDLKQWITRHMVNKYSEIFNDNTEFEMWADYMTEFVIQHYPLDEVPYNMCENEDILHSRIASAMVNELGEYPSNSFLDHYINTLSSYIYE